VWIHQRQRAASKAHVNRFLPCAVSREPFAPELEAGGRNGQGDLDAEAVAHSRRRHVRPGKEGQVRPRVAFTVGVKQVIGARVVLVDALLDQTHAEDASIEIQVLLSGAGDGRDVVEATDRGNRHDCALL